MYSPMHVRRSEITIATLLQRAGYATCHVGKWHLNGDFNLPSQPQPSDHGFDHWFSTQNNALPNHENPDNFVRNGQPVGPLQGYSAQLVAREAITWLKQGRAPRKPFFLFVCFHEPHEPIATDERFAAQYPEAGSASQAAHHGNVTQMDHAFGQLLRAVDDLQLGERTLVFFTSDNGPAITRRHPHGSAGPLREKKGHMYEGGIRVPAIIRWPGKTKPNQVCREPICGVDLLPTLCEITEIPVPDDRIIDGTSILPIFAGRPIQRKQPLYWQYNRASSAPKVAMRDGHWKLLATLSGPQLKPGADLIAEEMRAIRQAELDQFELYNLRQDLGETEDLASQQPERLRAMSAQLREVYRQVRDESPMWPEWKWPRYEAQRIQWGP
jgi:arylsulfatase A